MKCNSYLIVLISVTVLYACISITFAQNISYEKRWYEVSRGNCIEGLCYEGVPSKWANVKYEDVNTEIPKLEKPIFTDNINSVLDYMSKGYDVVTPIAALSKDSFQIINPISIYQLHFPQSWPTPLDDYFEVAALFPQVFFVADWQKVSINAPPKERRLLRIKELFAELARYEQLHKNQRFIDTKILLKKYGANIAPLHPNRWK